MSRGRSATRWKRGDFRAPDGPLVVVFGSFVFVYDGEVLTIVPIMFGAEELLS